MGKIIKNGIAYTSSSESALNINYNNNNTNLKATTAQGAITELNDKFEYLESLISSGGAGGEGLKDVAIQLLLENWTLNEVDNTYSQTVDVIGLTENSNPIIVINPADDVATEEELNAFNCLTSDVIVDNGSITFTAKELPANSFSVLIKGAIGGGNGGSSADVTELENRVEALENKLKDIAIPLLVENWVLDETDNVYTQTVTVEGIVADTNPAIMLSSVGEIATEEELNAYACIADGVVSEGAITFIATEKPAISFAVIAKGVVSGDGDAIGAVTELVGKVSELEGEVTELNSKLPKLLWENKNSTSSFGGQNITLNDTDYDYLEIITSYNGSAIPVIEEKSILKNSSALFIRIITSATTSNCINRNYALNESGNKLTVSDAKVSTFGNSTTTVDNTRFIPLKIIGYKYN